MLGAAGFAGALAAAIVERHPRLELTLVTARSDAGRRLDHLYPRHRVRRELETYRADDVAERADAAIVAYPHGAAAPVVEDLRKRGMKVVDLSADFRLDAGAVRALLPAARGARAARRGGLRHAGALPRGDPRGVARGRARLLPDRRHPRPVAAARADARRDRRRQVGRLGRRPRGHGRDPFRDRRRERERLQGRGPPPPRGARAGARASRPRSRSRRTSCRSTRGCSRVAT